MALDFSPLLGGIPESPTARGITAVGSALDAVLARRHQMEMQKQKDAADLLEKQMADQRQRDWYGIWSGAQDKNRVQRGTQFDANLGVKQRGQETREDNALAIQEGLVSKYEAEGSSEYEAANARLQQMRQDRVNRRRQGWATPAAQITPTSGDVSTTAQPAPAAAPPATPAPAVDLPGAVAAGAQAQVTPESVQPPPVASPPIPLAATPPATPPTGVAPVDLPAAVAPPVRPVGAQAVGDQWERDQLANQKHPEMIQVIKEQANVIRMRGRGYLDEADGKVNAVRERAARLENAKLMAANQKPQRDIAVDNKIMDFEMKLLRAVDSQVLKYYGVRALATETNTIQELGRIAGGAVENSALARMLIGRWARAGQGPGVLTDRDLTIFYNKIEGLAGRIKMSVRDVIDGKAPASVVKEIEKAIDVLRQSTQAKERLIGQRIVSLGKSPSMNMGLPRGQLAPGQADRILGWLETHAPGYIPNYEAEMAAEAAAPPSAPAARPRAGKAKPSSADADDLLKQAGGG